MSKFKFSDTKGRTWDLEVTLAAARRIDDSDYGQLTKVPISLMQRDDGLKATFGEIMTNNSLMCAVAFTILLPQMKIHFGCDPTESVLNLRKAELEFSESINGEVLQQIRTKLWESISDFFPEHRTALLLALESYETAIQKATKEVQDLSPMMSQVLDAKVNQGVALLKQQLQEELQKIAGQPSGV